MKCLFAFAALCSVFINCYSQTHPRVQQILKKHSWGITFTPAVIQKTHLSPSGGIYNVRSTPGPGLELLANYYTRMSEKGVLVISAGFLLPDYVLQFEVPGQAFEPDADFNWSNEPLKNFSFEITPKIQAEYQHHFDPDAKRGWYCSGGVSILYTFNQENYHTLALGDRSPALEFFQRRDKNNTGKLPWSDLHLAGGREWKFRTSKLIQLGIKLNYSPFSFQRGTYKIFPNNAPEASGSYRLKTSYAGVSATYIFGRTTLYLPESN